MALVFIDPNDRTPLYAQLERALRAAIATGRLGAGDQLPTVRELAETRGGVGSFISATGRAEARPAQEKTRRLRAFVTRLLADADASGFTLTDVLAELTAAHRQKGS